jgi:hypothetical protein
MDRIEVERHLVDTDPSESRQGGPPMEGMRATPSGESARPRGVLDAAVVLLAAWTLYCHALVFSGASFDALLRWSFVPVVLGAETRAKATAG